MLNEQDVGKALEQTVETAWYNLKDKRPSWVGLIWTIAKKREYSYKELTDILERACLELADEEDSYMPRLGNFLAFLKNGKVAATERTMGDAMVAWGEIEDCSWCIKGLRHCLNWDTPDHCDLQYYLCSCVKGQEMPQKPVYAGNFEEIKLMQEKYGDRFDSSKTVLYAGVSPRMPTYKAYDANSADEVPF